MIIQNNNHFHDPAKGEIDDFKATHINKNCKKSKKDELNKFEIME